MLKISQLIILFLLCRVVCGYGQSVKVCGKVTDEKKVGIGAVSLMVLDKNRHLLNYSITDTLGNFTISYDSKGLRALLVTSHLSYRSDTVWLSGRKDTTVYLQMKPYQYMMKEVAVKAKRVPIRYQDGDMIVNVENFLRKETDRSVEVLQKLPGVFINETNKQVLLNGKRVELQIDGRRQMATFELLKALPAKLLDQIVLIPDKRAEHDGDQEAAIINLKTKKKFIDGYVGNVGGNYGMYSGIGLPGEVEGDWFTMLMRKDFYLNILFHTEGNTDKEQVQDSTFYGNTGNYLLRDRVLTDRPWATITNMNLSWNVIRGHRISANLYVFTKNWNSSTESDGFDLNRGTTLYHMQSDGNRWNISGNVEYESSDSLPFKLKISYGYISAGENMDNDNEYNYSDHSENAYLYHYYQHGQQHILKTDFKKTFFQKKLTLNAGVKLNMGKTRNNSTYIPESETLKSNFFNYHEQVMTEYVSFGYRVSKKVYLNGGIRAEYTDYDLNLPSVEEHGTNQYWNVLPSAGVFFYLRKNYNTSLTFSSGVSRPNYNLLSPKETWHDDSYYSRGNPYLLPSKSYNLSWGNQIMRKLSLTLSGNYTKDLFSQVLLNKENQITEQTYMNCFDTWQVRGNISLPLSFIEGRLNVNLQGDWKYGRYRKLRNGFILPAGRNRSQSGTVAGYVDYWLSKQYRLKFSGSASYVFSSKSFQDDIQPSVNVTAGLLYKCMKNRDLWLNVFAMDIFDTEHIKKTSFYGSNIKFNYYKEKTQGFFIGLSYNFQGGKDLKREEKTEDANEEDKRFDED